MDFKGQHILEAKQFDKEGLLALFEEAKKMEGILDNGGGDLMKDKIMATLFFEPSTRTRFSFETAMHRLGGSVISNPDMMRTSSLKKSETLEDTGKTVSQMADVIVMRHPEAGSVAKLASKSDVPVLNAGDGAHDHPTQGLLDVYTIWREKGGLDGLTVGMVGDLKYGRVVHAECEMLSYFDVKFVFVSPEGLKMPEGLVDDARELVNLEEVIGELDVISMTRIQRERFESEEEYNKYAGLYVLDAELMKKAKDDSIVIHPLPRVDEISVEVDYDPRAKYFDQPRYGVAVRMALLKMVMA
ncbi:MAG: aspartate carbamoyltransferase [bacterium]|nr:aspartate carbamoyltransferase [bacterium]